jgi:hypothetical protein
LSQTVARARTAIAVPVLVLVLVLALVKHYRDAQMLHPATMHSMEDTRDPALERE